jgi:hypothetical protein
VFHDWRYTGDIFLNGGDILFGHPNKDMNTPFWRSLKYGDRIKRVLMFPFHHALPEVNRWADPLVMACEKYIAITAPHWMNTIQKSEFAHWKPKMVRVDMAINTRDFPLVKTRFNERRKAFAIGDPRPEKGQDYLINLATVADIELIYIGIAPITSNRKIEIWPAMRLDEAAARAIADQCDLFIHTGVSDANPTTILEVSSWGFPVAATKGSGWSTLDGVVDYTLTRNPAEDAIMLDNVMSADQFDFEKKHDIAERYHWKKFTDVVLRTLDEFHN